MSVFKNNRGTWNFKCYYTDSDGNRRQKKKEGFLTKKEAKASESEFLINCKKECHITFKKLTALYMADCEIRLKPTTYANKEQLINSKILPCFGNMKLDEINIADVRKWQNELISHEKNYSLTYLKSIHNQLSAILNYAVKYQGLNFNAAAKCGSMGKKNAEEMNFWTISEFNQFINHVDNITSKTAFYLLFFSGLREGELLALNISDFDFETNTVSVTKSFARVKGKEIIQTPKTAKSKRTVSLPGKIMEIISEYYKSVIPNERLFPLTKDHLLYELNKYCKISGVKKIRIHDLRHSYASMLIELGVTPLEIQERLGHENIQTTLNTYSHLYPNKQNETTKKIEKLIF